MSTINTATTDPSNSSSDAVPPAPTGAYPRPNLQIESEDILYEIIEPLSIKARPSILFTIKLEWGRVVDLLVKNDVGFMGDSTREGMKIFPNSPDDFAGAIKLLDDQMIPYRTSLLTSEDVLLVVLKGVPACIEPIEIYKKLCDINIRPINIIRMNDRHYKPVDNVTVEVHQECRKINDLKSLFGLKITVEPLINKKTSIQCERCQKWNHLESDCKAVPKCIKCAEDHLSKECTKRTKAYVKCANCGGPHPANYRGCPAWPLDKQFQSVDSTSQKKGRKNGSPRNTRVNTNLDDSGAPYGFGHEVEVLCEQMDKVIPRKKKKKRRT